MFPERKVPMVTLNEERTKRNDAGNIVVVLESDDMSQLLEGATRFAIKKAAEMGLAPAGVLNMPRPMAIDEATDGPITGPGSKLKCYRVEVLCGSAIP